MNGGAIDTVGMLRYKKNKWTAGVISERNHPLHTFAQARTT